MANVVREKKKVNPNLQYMRDKDKEKVKGIFRYYEVPGGSVSFAFKKYKGDRIEQHHLIDGEIYTLPLGVAKHLNNNCWYPKYSHMESEEDVVGGFAPNGLGRGMQGMRVTQKVRRMGFQSLEFTDVEEVDVTQSELVDVKYDTNLIT